MNPYLNVFLIHGVEITVIKTETSYCLVQVPCVQFDTLMKNLDVRNTFEKFLQKEISNFYVLSNGMMELVVPSHTDLYRWFMEEKKKEK